MTEHEDLKSIALPSDVLARIEKRVEYTEFETVSEYTSYVLREVLANVEERQSFEEGEPVDEDEVRGRLKSLGYLNQ